MTFVITDPTTINAIRDAYNQAVVTRNWSAAYSLVFDAITVDNTAIVDGSPVLTSTPATGVDQAAWLWIGGARYVNSGTPNDLICASGQRGPRTKKYRRWFAKRALDSFSRPARNPKELRQALEAVL